MKKLALSCGAIFFAAIGVLMVVSIISQAVAASSDDKVLTSLEESYQASANNANLAHENTIAAQNLERELKAHACLDWKATAYYKLANNIPMVNQMTLAEIDAVDCNAVGL